MFDRLKEMSERLVEDILRRDEEGTRAIFGPVLPLPRGTDLLTRLIALGSLASLILLSGIAIFSLAGLLFACLSIYLVLTQVLGIHLDLGLDLGGEGPFA